MIWLILLIIGLAAGVISGIFGVGGGLIIMPALLLGLNLPAQTATATSLVALLLPVGGLAVWEYWHAGKLTHQYLLYGLMIAFGLFIGAYFGARFAVSLNETTMRKAFAIFLVCMAALIWWRA